MIHDLAQIIQFLDQSGRLIRVTSEVDPTHELAGIAAEYEGGPRAILFEKVKGQTAPVFVGLYWSRDLLAALMGRDEKDLPGHVSNCVKAWQQKPVDPIVVASGPVIEITELEVDLTRLPIPVHAALDGGGHDDLSRLVNGWPRRAGGPHRAVGAGS